VYEESGKASEHTKFQSPQAKLTPPQWGSAAAAVHEIILYNTRKGIKKENKGMGAKKRDDQNSRKILGFSFTLLPREKSARNLVYEKG